MTDYDSAIDMVRKNDEMESLVREMVEVERRHPKAALLPERAAQVAAARDEAARRLGRLTGAEPARPAVGPGPLLRFRPGEIRETARAGRADIGRAVPRPLALLSGRPRRRA